MVLAQRLRHRPWPRALLLGLCMLAVVGCRAAPQIHGAGTDAEPVRRQAVRQAVEGSVARPLRGRFLHITDLHPDPFFKTYSSTEEDAACHRKHGPAGIYGAETSGCDSPLSLINETFKWIKQNLRDDIDFIVWTGDSARHDNDEKIPRTQKQIIEQNEFAVSKFVEVFGKGDDDDDDDDPTNDLRIPVVPTFGNNDIMPHNIMLSGPNRWTLKYLDIWRNFIPEAQRHQFQRGGWFYVEVIPQKLAVVSLNTLYFFDSNSGVDGCADKHEPGYEHMEWLRIQLQILRERGMKAILMGHVPPARTDSKLSWDETCWQKFTLWQRQYRDILVGNLFGHMNIDHFMLQDFEDLKKSTKRGKMKRQIGQESEAQVNMYDDGELETASASDYLLDLRDAWAKLPSPPKKNGVKSHPIEDYVDAEEEQTSIWQWVVRALLRKKKGDKDSNKKFIDEIGGQYGERFALAHVSPSVVPNYFPTLRVFEYNITGLENALYLPAEQEPSTAPVAVHTEEQPLFSDSDVDADLETASRKKKEKEASKKKKKKYKFKVPKSPSKSAPPGPAYSPQTLSLLGYTQYFANLTHINNDFVNPQDVGNASLPARDAFEASKWKEGKHGKHQGKRPSEHPHPKKFQFEVEYTTRDDEGYGLKDLTVRSFLDLAGRIGKTGTRGEAQGVETEKKKKKKQKKKKPKKPKKTNEWFTFVKRAFVGTLDPRDIEEQFAPQPLPFSEHDRDQEVLEL